MKTSPSRVLIVEDDVSLFGAMSECLTKWANEQDIAIEILRADTLRDALTAWENNQPFAAVSVDMQFPIFKNEEVWPDNGAEFLCHLYQGESKSHPYKSDTMILYTGVTISDAEEILSRYGISGDITPLILRKEQSSGHDEWAKNMMLILSNKEN